MELNYSILPAHMRDAARDYVERGFRPGGFLTAVLSNDFQDALGRADDINRGCLLEWAEWVHWNCPSAAQGSPEKVKAWIERGGLRGRPE